MLPRVKQYFSEPTAAATLVLCWLFILRLSGLYLFTSGFLLSRLSLNNVNECTDCTLPPTHKRAIFLIIDALRFDFIAPNPPNPSNDDMHHVLTLPQELTSKHPQHSFIFNAHSDPPTATMQRIKGITTGSLPTFVDVSANFGATSIEEDSLLKQLQLAGKKVAFMGDDTWMSLYKDFLDPTMRFPYDSFNVEDLHSVDNGVIEHLFPLLKSPPNTWDFLIGHFLGVDHVGHRVGPSHPTMRAKLKQMNDVLGRVVKLMDDDTLLVLIGDHGMDSKGDHGGDGILETSSAMWIYSKSHPLQMLPSNKLSETLTPNVTFPEATSSWRSVQQIDLVPSLSLLLGLPIPFNNLGTVIPELFHRSDNLPKALRFTTMQIKAYLDAYRSSASGGELDPYWSRIDKAYKESMSLSKMAGAPGDATLTVDHLWARMALELCRTLWARFSMPLIILGLIVIVLTIPVGVLLTEHLDQHAVDWSSQLFDATLTSILSSATSVAVGFAASFFPSPTITDPLPTLHAILFYGSLGGTLGLIYQLRSSFSWKSYLSPPSSIIILVVQAILLFSNSFVFWEERVIPFFLISSLLPFLHSILKSPLPKLRNRALIYGGIFVLLVRLMSISTICREEQGSYCHVTFYASSVLPSPPLFVRMFVLPAALALPTIGRRFMRIAAADHGLAPFAVEVFFRAALTGGTVFWFLDWLESSQALPYLTESLGLSDSSAVRMIRTTTAITIGWASGIGLALWSASPLNLAIRKQKDASGREVVQVLGFANSFGSFYLSFLLYIFAIVWLGSQLSGQIVLALALSAFLCYLEFVDTVRDIRFAGLNRIYRGPSFTEILPLSLLGLEIFYATGHEATLSSLQWKSAFIFTGDRGSTSPFTVTLNTVGPTVFFALATPLLALWAIEPFNKLSSLSEQKRRVAGGAFKSILLTSNYHTVILAATAACGMVLRRHLMVWKVFAPRFMLAGLCSVAVDVAGIIAMLGGVSTVVHRVSSTFQGVGQ